MSNLEKYLTKNEINSLNNLQKSMLQNQITVTCVGLYNHGKSTLLNVLIKDFEYKTFKTADARETTLNKAVLYNGIKYVDTPGLNAQVEDDKKVMEAVENSDITLFVHNINTGEFNKAEINFLQQIQKHWKNPKEFIERTIFILSKIDESNNKNIEEASQRMKEQIKNIFDSDSLIVSASSTDYAEGMLNNEEELIVESNIKKLEEKIEFLIKKSKEEITKTKKNRFEKKYWELYQKLNSKIKDNQQKINTLKAKQKKIDNEFKSDINKIEDTLKSMYERIS